MGVAKLTEAAWGTPQRRDAGRARLDGGGGSRAMQHAVVVAFVALLDLAAGSVGLLTGAVVLGTWLVLAATAEDAFGGWRSAASTRIGPKRSAQAIRPGI